MQLLGDLISKPWSFDYFGDSNMNDLDGNETPSILESPRLSALTPGAMRLSLMTRKSHGLIAAFWCCAI